MLSLKQIKSLSHKKYREVHKRFIIEGPDVVQYFLECGYPVESIYVDEKAVEKYSRITLYAKRNKIELKKNYLM